MEASGVKQDRNSGVQLLSKQFGRLDFDLSILRKLETFHARELHANPAFPRKGAVEHQMHLPVVADKGVVGPAVVIEIALDLRIVASAAGIVLDRVSAT